MGVSQGTISNWETKWSRIYFWASQLDRLATALHTTPNYSRGVGPLAALDQLVSPAANRLHSSCRSQSGRRL